MSAYCRNNRCACWNSQAQEQSLCGSYGTSAVEDCEASGAARDARPTPGPHKHMWLCAGLDKSTGPSHFLRVSEIRMRDRVRKSGQLLFQSTEKFVKQNTDAIGVARHKERSLIAFVVAQLWRALQRLEKVVALPTCESQQHCRTPARRTRTRIAFRCGKFDSAQCA